MQYGAITLRVRFGAKNTTTRKSQVVRHYPGTDKSDVFDLGKSPTEIACRVIAESEPERIELEALLHAVVERDLTIGSRYYKRVITGEVSEWQPLDTAETKHYCDVTFICLDPVPYDVTTEEALY